MNAQLSTTDTRTADRTAEQLAAIADREQAERDAQTLARELFEARREIVILTQFDSRSKRWSREMLREVSRLRHELSSTRDALAASEQYAETLQEKVLTLEHACQ